MLKVPGFCARAAPIVHPINDKQVIIIGGLHVVRQPDGVCPFLEDVILWDATSEGEQKSEVITKQSGFKLGLFGAAMTIGDGIIYASVKNENYDP